jgi:EmrB/QacA subfamily drug resistance transporter
MSATSTPELRFIQGPSAGRTVPLAGKLTVGRDRACDLLVNDEEMSRRHLRITRKNGHAEIEDLNSLNGTFVNGERVLGARDIEAGDRIEMGNTIVELSVPGVTRLAPVAQPPQVTSVGQVLARSSELLTTASSSRKWWTLVVVCAANFMLLLDTSIVSVALPDISTALNTSFDQLQWVINAYSLTLAVVLLTAGSLSDMIGRRLVFTIGLAIFTVTSALCGFAGDGTTLDIARGAQGIGGGLMLAPSLALLAQEFPPHERANAFAAWGAVTASAIAAGPLIGGALTGAFGWRSIFFVNVPIGIIAIGVTLAKLVNLPGPPSKIDWFGLATFSTAVFMIMFALIEGNDKGWGSTLILVLLGGGVVLLVLFIVGETQVKYPMVDFSIFRKITTSGASVAAFCTSASALAMIIYLTVWLQSILGYGPFQCGLRLLPLTALGLLVKPAAGRFLGNVSPSYILGGGLTLIAGGLFAMSAVSTNSKWTVMLPGLLLTGVGLGLVSPTLAQVSVGIVHPRQSGMASGVNTTFRQLGLVTGVAGLGAIFQHKVLVNVTNALHGTQAAYLTPSFAQTVSSGGTINYLDKAGTHFRPVLHHTAKAAYSSGLSTILIVAAVVAALGAVGGLLLVRKGDLVGLGGPPGGGPPGGGPPGGGPPGGGPPGGGPPGGWPPGGGPPGGVPPGGGPPGGGPPGGGPPGGGPPGGGPPGGRPA